VETPKRQTNRKNGGNPGATTLKERTMITNIKTKGFKGFEINEALSQKTIYYGKNKSGKSSRSHAIALTILGYIPFAAKVNKKASDILNDFGVGDSLTTAITCNNVEFERHFSRSAKGVVSQRLRVDKKKVSATDYAVMLNNAGNPRIVDVNDFMLLSDQKKIDILFTLFPPDIDINDLENKIDKAKTKVNNLQGNERTFVSVIQRLTASKSAIELPAGSLPEIRSAIEAMTQMVRDAQADLKQIEIEEAKEAAKTEQKKDSQVEFDRIMAEKTEPYEQKRSSLETPKFTTDELKEIPVLGIGHNPAQSIQKIINVMQDAGCETCAALLVAKMELKKYK
jgi:hypothetical protein